MRLAAAAILGVLGLLATSAAAAGPAGGEFLVFSRCKPGMKAQCDRWYAKHLRDITRIEGVASARQYEVVPVQGRDGMKKDRLIVYQLVGDPSVVLARLRPAVEAGRLQSPDPKLFETPFETVVVRAADPEGHAAAP